ncbi:uncharacterized protein LOC128546133 [Mercenaria mercenaria]|uniref:uncharacterized protein LOC128546133 n=1 Tax=Mercenaria mercenaria TaxID=6596 RepID=UPI00234F45A9|nr:uncharacterized protein LOC128546133 [Mercenaria mercenaria]
MLMKSCTGEYEEQFNPKTMCMEQKLMRYVDPFENVTIAATCAKIYRTKFLEEKWRVTLKHANHILEKEFDAFVKNDQMSVKVDDRWIPEKKLWSENYTIDARKFVSTSIAQIPSNGYQHDRYSKKSIHWLEWVMEKAITDGNPIKIQHALNAGEFTIPNTKYKLDGYCHSTNTAYEFHGCQYHGCWKCIPHHRDEIQVPTTKQTPEELYALTKKKERYIKELGMNYVSIWEHQFDLQLKQNQKMCQFINTLDIVDRLHARDALFGGRTEATRLYYKANTYEKVKYVDFTSLYPWTNKYCKYPVGHPDIITSQFKDISCYFGIAKVKILPPKGLYHPVLPYRSNGKLKFPLCKTCAGNESQTECLCTDELRAIVGTYCTPEIEKAIEQGYTLLKIYEVYHFPKTEQYDPTTKTGGIFTEYINTFLKLKQESSGWPDWIETEDDKTRYLNNYWENEGIQLDYSNIQKKKGKRALFWGKFGQKQNMRQTCYFHESQEDKFFQLISDVSKNVTNFHVISKDMIIMEWEHNRNYVPDDTKANVFIAAFKTCWERLKLMVC